MDFNSFIQIYPKTGNPYSLTCVNWSENAYLQPLVSPDLGIAAWIAGQLKDDALMAKKEDKSGCMAYTV